MITTIELIIQLSFELGEKYRYLYEKAGLDNVIDFNDIEFANSKGAQWGNFKGDMSDFPEILKVTHDQSKINELNSTADDLKILKRIAKNIIEGEKNGN